MEAHKSGSQSARSRILIRRAQAQPSRKYRFESFSDRIARIKIDPVRQDRSQHASKESQDGSFFVASLTHCAEHNLSETFAEFVRFCRPLAQSLPQVIHNQNKLIQLLIEYLRKEDALCLDSLLDLLFNIARDLGSKFEEHYEKTVRAIIDLASHHAEVIVVEKSFTTLASLFKLLAKLLIPDLRPTFALLEPLLGRERQKVHVVRFAGEALAFLMRKAAQRHTRNPGSLQDLCAYVLDRWKQCQDCAGGTDLFKHGLMTLFSSAIKSTNRSLSVFGPDILKTLLLSADISAFQAPLQGIITNVLHHVDDRCSDLDLIAEIVRDSLTAQNRDCRWQRSSAMDLLSIFLCVRGGRRIPDWKPWIRIFLHILQELPDSGTGNVHNDPTALCGAAIFASAEPNDLVGLSEDILCVLHRCGQTYLKFVCMLYEINQENFEQFVVADFSAQTMKSWNLAKTPLDASDLLTIILTGIKPCTPDSPVLNDWIAALIEPPSTPDPLINGRLHAGYEILERQGLKTVHIDTLLRKIQNLNSLPTEESDQSRSQMLVLGSCLTYVLKVFTPEEFSDILPWTLSQHCLTMPTYLENSMQIGLSCRPSGLDESFNIRSCSLLQNLSSPSARLRRSTLQLLLVINAENDDSVLQQILELCLKIETTERTFDNSRTISMFTRELPSITLPLSEGHAGRFIVLYFLLGVIHYNLALVKVDAIDGLKALCVNKLCSEHLSRVLAVWLSVSEVSDETELPSRSSTSTIASTEFHCTNFQKWRELDRQQAGYFAYPSQTLDQWFEKKHVSEPLEDSTCFNKALELFKSLPTVFEGRSKMFVPRFLSVLSKIEDSGISEEDISAESLDPGRPTIAPKRQNSRVHKRMLLDVLSNTQNPRVLHRAPDLYDAVLNLLMDGELDTQKRALNAVLRWNQPQITAYSENLYNLLDPARFTDELPSFLTSQESSIQKTDHGLLLPVLLRVIYGRLTSRSGQAGNESMSQNKRRLLGLRVLAEQPQKLFLQEFANLALGSLAKVHFRDGCLIPPSSVPSIRVQFGIMNMLSSMLDVLKENSDELGAVPIAAATWVLVNQTKNHASEPIQALARSVRQSAINCLSHLYSHCEAEICEQSIEIVHREFVVSKLTNLVSESTESVSGILRLLAAFVNSPTGVSLLLKGDRAPWNVLLECTANMKTKAIVKSFIFSEILLRVVQSCRGDTSRSLAPRSWNLSYQLLQDKLSPTIRTLSDIIKSEEQVELLKSAVELMLNVTDLIKSTAESSVAVQAYCALLNKSSRCAPFNLKGRALAPLKHCLSLSASTLDENMFLNIFESLSALYDYFLDKPNRDGLTSALSALIEHREDLKRAVMICEDLNSIGGDQFDSVQYDKRDRAFEAILHGDFSTYSEVQLIPILHNLVFFLRTSDDLSVQQSAGLALRNFVYVFAGKAAEGLGSSGIRSLFERLLIPGLHTIILKSNETGRAEGLGVIAQLAKHAAVVASCSDLIPLLADDDDEASFFSNILHIQQHRRIRALKRLSGVARASGFQEDTVLKTFLPLLEHFIFNPAEAANAHGLTFEATNVIVDLMHSVDFRQWLSLFQKYLARFKSTDSEAKILIRLFEALINSLAESYSDRSKPDFQETLGNHESHYIDLNRLARTVPSSEKLHKMVCRRILPSFTHYMHVKDEDTIELRIQLSVPLIRLLKLFPETTFSELLPPLLTDISQILRSRSQETRDLVRKSLGEILAICGQQYFKFLLQELKTALTRGYQVHVLSYTVHSLLVNVASHYPYGALDEALPIMSEILLDDILGLTGQEKDAEGYTNKMKEVKGRKSFDSVTILSRMCNLTALSRLLSGLRPFLRQNSNNNQSKKAQEVMRRISSGLGQNPAIQTPDALILCHELLLPGADTVITPNSHSPQTGLANPVTTVGSSSHRGFTSDHLTKFAYDLLRNVVTRAERLNSPKYIGQFIPLLNDHLLDSAAEVKASVFQVLTQVIRLKLAGFESGSPIYIREALRAIDNKEALGSELGQSALKFLTAISKERISVTFRDSDLTKLIKILKQDLENSTRQASNFAFLKTVIARKYLNVDVYDILDKVATIMVTSQTAETRELSRSCFVQFFFNYPQGKGRLSKTITFLIKNLDYQHAEGRTSVMECIYALISRYDSDVTQQLVSALFLPLAMSICNDEDSQCRKLAAHLCQSLFTKADPVRLRVIMDLLAAWSDPQKSSQIMLSLSLHLYAMLVNPESSIFETQLNSLCAKCSDIIAAGRFHAEDDWEMIYYSLKLLQKILLFPATTLNTSSVVIPWSAVIQRVSFPHIWVRTVASQLSEHMLSSLSLTTYAEYKVIGADDVVLARPDGLEILLSDLMGFCKSSLHALSLPSITQELTLQIVQNIALVTELTGNVRVDQVSFISGERLQAQQWNASDERNQTTTIAILIFDAITSVIRKEPNNLTMQGLSPRSACLRLCGVLCSKLAPGEIEPSLNKVLRALYNLTDKSIAVPFSPSELVRNEIENIRGNATELLDCLQVKFAAKYIDSMAKISRETKELRDTRRVKRRRDQTHLPEIMSQVKRKKIERQKTSRKIKSQEQRGSRRGW